jgi:hypothetical protein
LLLTTRHCRLFSFELIQLLGCYDKGIQFFLHGLFPDGRTQIILNYELCGNYQVITLYHCFLACTIDKILESLGAGNAGNDGKDAGTTKRTPLLASTLKTTLQPCMAVATRRAIPPHNSAIQ